ncbi:MAG: BMP family ABC transporter substrate-binding protein, partial [Desulfobacula sp.]|nr:BMP family ABC transporter substrate-binding protein [Desulfobacula sp.]
MKKWMLLVLICSIFFMGFSITSFAADKKLKAGFVYVGPVGDYGWSHAHDMGKKFAEKKLPWLETIIVESV